MLISYKDAPYPVGIAVSSWKIDGHLRSFVIFPILENDKFILDVDCFIEEENKMIIVSPQTQTWRPLTNGFGDDSEGYPCDDETMDMLYKVWDSGILEHPELSERLYSKYGELISRYTPAALAYLRTKTEEEYSNKIDEAKKRGFDTNLIAQLPIDFPYENNLH